MSARRESANNKRKRLLAQKAVDDFSREMVGQLLSVSISGRQVARFSIYYVKRQAGLIRLFFDNSTGSRRSLDQAQREIEQRRHYYHPVRPHRSLNSMPLVAFVEQAA